MIVTPMVPAMVRKKLTFEDAAPNCVGGVSFCTISVRFCMTMPRPAPSTMTSPSAGIAASSAYQAALGNALIVAAHAESARGTHGDLLQILNHEQHPWGFSYSAYPHRVRVWYGDRDEKIAENAVLWMERAMGEGRCEVKVVKGADHGLMYRSSVVIEVLERVRDFWADGALSPRSLSPSPFPSPVSTIRTSHTHARARTRHPDDP